MRASLDELVDTVLKNDTRRRIFLHLLGNPGDHYRNILRTLCIGNGTLMYHLRVMERAKAIRVRRSGGRARYYPMEVMPVQETTDLRKRIMEAIARSPGVTDMELTHRLDRSLQWIRVNINALEDAMLIGVHRDGSTWRCYLLVPRPSTWVPCPDGMYQWPEAA